MRNLCKGLWSGLLVACLSSTVAIGAEGKPKESRPLRPEAAGNVASVGSAERISAAHITATPVSVVESTGTAAGLGSNSCQTPEAITGTGEFSFDNSAASQDGPAHGACTFFGQSQLDNDIWFCWTAPQQVCNGTYVITTCDRTDVDTKIALYNGCSCPTNDTNLLNCRDDECEVQTRATFQANPGQQFMIRLGTFPGEPGGQGTFSITCEVAPPCDEPATHCQTQDQSDALNSNWTGFRTADGFTPTQSGNINSVCWWGAYLNDVNQNCEASTSDSFRIRYFADNNGVPGSLITTFSQQNGTLTVEDPFLTGLLINGVAAEYEFHATHANVPVVGTDCYWIEITNEITGCTWFWELGLSGDGRAVQDGLPGAPPNGYAIGDVIVGDMAFCTNLVIEQEGTSCLPPPPANNNCAAATSINGTGTFVVDTAAATTDGPEHPLCNATNEAGIGRDVWYKWTSNCTGDVVIRTCDTTTVDSKIAVYNGVTCPSAATTPAACNDDLCGPRGFQSMVVFSAVQNQQYLLRVGSFPEAPGGVIGFVVSCGPPNNAACGAPGDESSCCAGNAPDTPGCGNESCCELVCACDSFCCEVEWDDDCAAHGFGDSGCGAADLCGCGGVCGNPLSGSCCTGHPAPGGCNDAACCESVCACDPFCCDTEWDDNCANNGFVPGCGARVLCGNLCTAPAPCPAGTISFVNPPAGAVDARRPHPPGNPNLREGFRIFTVTGPQGAQNSCWSVQETATFGSPNAISSVVENPPGTYTVTLNRVITAGAGTSITYTPTGNTGIRGCFKSHPANVNSDTGAAPIDIIHLIDHLNGVRVPPLSVWQCDLDRSSLCLPADIITEIDMLNGTNGFIVWNGTPRPVGPGTCP